MFLRNEVEVRRTVVLSSAVLVLAVVVSAAELVCAEAVELCGTEEVAASVL